MKRNLLFTLAAAALTLFTACDSKTELAGKVAGTWGSNPQMLANEVASQSTIIETFNFVRDSTSAGGSVIVSGMISLTGTVNESNALVQPLTATAAARSTISGTWQVVDDDEIILTLNPQSLSVEVDPQGVVMSVNEISGTDSADTDALRPQLAETIRRNIMRELQSRYMMYGHLDDAKVYDSGSSLKFEIDHDVRVVLHREI